MTYNIPQKLNKNPGDEQIMLTLSVAGKSGDEAVKIISEAVNSSEAELKILIDNPSQAEDLKKYLTAQGFSDIVPEDDDGTLYLTAIRRPEQPQENPKSLPQIRTEPQISGILISCEAKKYNPDFLQRFLAALTKSEHKPQVIGIMNSAVKIAAYDSGTCDTLKKLEAEGVRLLISSSCADRMGITEAIGAGVKAEMNEIIDEVLSCEKVISL